ncbi:MAG: hypothetical protein WCK49_01620 [Myxococcaceae bacterium]
MKTKSLLSILSIAFLSMMLNACSSGSKQSGSNAVAQTKKVNFKVSAKGSHFKRTSKDAVGGGSASGNGNTTSPIDTVDVTCAFNVGHEDVTNNGDGNDINSKTTVNNIDQYWTNNFLNDSVQIVTNISDCVNQAACIICTLDNNNWGGSNNPGSTNASGNDCTMTCTGEVPANSTTMKDYFNYELIFATNVTSTNTSGAGILAFATADNSTTDVAVTPANNTGTVVPNWLDNTSDPTPYHTYDSNTCAPVTFGTSNALSLNLPQSYHSAYVFQDYPFTFSNDNACEVKHIYNKTVNISDITNTESATNSFEFLAVLTDAQNTQAISDAISAW